jgi:hypothetical protein
VDSDSESPRPTKRKAARVPKSTAKKRKVESESELSDADELSGSASIEKAPPKPRKPTRAAKPRAKPSKKVSDESEEDKPTVNDEASDSDLSSLIDEAPAPKSRSKNKKFDPRSKGGGKGKKAAAVKPKKSQDDDDPDQAEIKRLQMWLGKCGIRKVWGAYLKPYETPKAKIGHLKSMLSDVGMAGRYSEAKAQQIKESRELAADLEAVQEMDQRWGANESEGDEDSKPRGRLVHGAKAYDFLSSDGEETS